jgi:aspartate racemase
MKTIGMLGGMSWESTRLYYEITNREVQQRLGGVHSAKILLWSFDFGEISELQRTGRWDTATVRMADAAVRLARGGADFLVIACNTMHLMADEVERAAGIPLLHIADPVGDAIKADGLSRVGLLGSCFTMEDDRIVKGRLLSRYGIETILPGKADAAEVDRIILDELVRGELRESSRIRYRATIGDLVARGAEGIVLGCTEIPLLMRAEDSAVPLYDTVTLHALAAVERALA